MDSFTTQKSKSRKVKRPMKKSRVQTILDLIFQAIEIIVVVVTVAKLCYELVITLHDSGVAAVILANRTLAFVVGNAIVIALIAKSGLLLNQELVPKVKSNDLYDEFVSRDGMRNRGKQSAIENEAKPIITETTAKQSETEKEIQRIYEKITKQSISDQGEGQTVTEKKTKQSTSVKREKKIKPEKLIKQSTSVKRDKQSIVEHQEITVEKQSYQRSRSENPESYCGKLRRSETDASSERFESDDELRLKIESFIARQRRNQNDD